MAAKVWIDGAPVDAAQARVPVFDRGFLYGDSVYEVLRTFGGRPFALEEHLDRLAHSAHGLEMALPPRAAIRAAVEETLAAAGEPEAYIRIVVTRGAGEIALDPAMADAPRLVVMVKPVRMPDPSLYSDGADVVVVSKHRAPDPSVKSGNYLVSVLAVAEARRRGAYEAILTDAVGRLTEGSSSNFFVVRGGRAATPPVSAGLLEGITRRKLIALARGAGISVDELPLWPLDLCRADEALLTSSVRGVMPVVRVDGQPIGDGRPGPITRRLMALYDRLTAGDGGP
jgi:branched-chain amino acid aminotransferase